MRWWAVAGAVGVAGCGASAPVTGDDQRRRAAGEPSSRTMSCARSFGRSAYQLQRRRRVVAGPVELLVPEWPRSVVGRGGVKVPLWLRPGSGLLELRLRTDRVAGWTEQTTGAPREGLPGDAVPVLRVERCPGAPVAYAGWIALAREACVPVDVTERATGRRVRVRLSLGRACSPPG